MGVMFHVWLLRGRGRQLSIGTFSPPVLVDWKYLWYLRGGLKVPMVLSVHRIVARCRGVSAIRGNVHCASCGSPTRDTKYYAFTHFYHTLRTFTSVRQTPEDTNRGIQKQFNDHLEFDRHQSTVPICLPQWESFGSTEMFHIRGTVIGNFISEIFLHEIPGIWEKLLKPRWLWPECSKSTFWSEIHFPTGIVQKCSKVDHLL